MRNLSYFIVIAFLFFFTIHSPCTYSIDVKNIKLESFQDTAYLPYRYDEVVGQNGINDRQAIFREIHVYDSNKDLNDQKWFIRLYNPAYNADNPAIITQRSFPRFDTKDDDPVSMIIHDCILYYDSEAECKSMVGVGYKNDSAWLFRLFPGNDSLVVLFLATGRDAGNDGKWGPNLYMTLFEDYDFDNKHEAFIYVNSVRDDGPKELFCVEVETLEIEWTLPIASELSWNSNFYSCRDSINPAVIFITGNPKQGYTDDNYNDLFGYISIVNNKGELVFNKILETGIFGTRLIEAEKDGYFYVIHEIPFTDPDTVYIYFQESDHTGLNDKVYHISKVNRSGEIVFTTETADRPGGPFMHRYGPEQNPAIYIRFIDKSLRVYDTSLILLAEMASFKAGAYLGETKIEGYDNALVFSDGIYTSQLDKLLYFPGEPLYFEPLEIDSLGQLRALIQGGANMYSIGYIEKKELVELVSVFYHRNQIYILMAISALIVALLFANYYRGKNKRNMNLIARQKLELEQSHDALRKAQKKIVEQEKYKQAKDIAGGFAHEIRNALFPAESMVGMLLKLKDERDMKSNSRKEYLTDAKNAINRAIEITELISEYTKLDSEFLPESVLISDILNDVLDANKLRIDQQDIQIDIQSEKDVTIRSNNRQLYMVFNNLLLNSLDALINRKNPVLEITVKPGKDYAEVEFKDNGAGIKRENSDKIFNTFFSTKPYKGSGFGLSVARKIVEMYGGEIRVESEENIGTRFYLKLMYN